MDHSCAFAKKQWTIVLDYSIGLHFFESAVMAEACQWHGFGSLQGQFFFTQSCEESGDHEKTISSPQCTI